MKHLPQSKQAKMNANAEADIYTALSLLSSADEVRQLMQDLCTPAEIQALADRFRVVADIKLGKSYRQINAETDISVTTIGRVARALMLGQGGYDLAYQRMAQLKDK